MGRSSRSGCSGRSLPRRLRDCHGSSRSASTCRTLGLAAAGSVLGAVLAGVAPALWTVRRSLPSGLRGASRPGSATTRGQVGSQILVASQIAFALLVTVAAALLVRSLQQLQAADMGFSLAKVSVVEVPLRAGLQGSAATTGSSSMSLSRGWKRRLALPRRHPSCCGRSPAPMGGTPRSQREGQGREEASANPGLHLEAVLPNYFSTMAIQIVRGRAFSDSDRKAACPLSSSASLWRATPVGVHGSGKRLKFGTPEALHHG